MYWTDKIDEIVERLGTFDVHEYSDPKDAIRLLIDLTSGLAKEVQGLGKEINSGKS